MVTAEPAYLESRSALADLSTKQTDQQYGDNHSDRSEQVDLSSPPSSLTDNSDTDENRSTTSSSVKCSAVHTLERDMPDYDYSHLVESLRKLIVDHADKNPGTYSAADLDKCLTDDWFLSRFLLRQKMDLNDAYEMLKQAMRFNHESLANHLRPEDFPAEFYQLGGLVPYGSDRKGNKMLYLRVRIHRKTPEITSIVQAFIYYNIKRIDDEAKGKGISVVIDCTGGGLANADMDTLIFIITTLKSYFPKGLSYFLVHEMPWILKPFWHLAKAWIPEEHRQLIKFSDSRNVNEFIDQDQLPDFMGGQVPESEWKQVPENCIRLEQAAKLWGIEKRLIARVLDKFRDHLPVETVARIDDYYNSNDANDGTNQTNKDDLCASGGGPVTNQMFRTNTLEN